MPRLRFGGAVYANPINYLAKIGSSLRSPLETRASRSPCPSEIGRRHVPVFGSWCHIRVPLEAWSRKMQLKCLELS
jgi:hypothetical protein